MQKSEPHHLERGWPDPTGRVPRVARPNGPGAAGTGSLALDIPMQKSELHHLERSMKGFLWRYRATQPAAPFGRFGLGCLLE